MILRLLVLTCAIFVSPSLGRLDPTRFSAHFENKCFQNEETDPFRVNGQDTPLSNTLENFIALTEKFEAANPGLNLRDELAFFLNGYVYENIKFIGGKLGEFTVSRAHFDIIYSMWDPDFNRNGHSSYDIPFTDAENCSLYHMISHSILKKDVELLSSRNSYLYSNGNLSSTQARSQELNPDDYYPQELGVVAIRGTDAAVSLSKVLMGLYVGLKPNRFSALSSYEKIQIPYEDLPQDVTVDELYAVTMAEVIMNAQWVGSERKGLAPNGKWVSIPIDNERKIEGFCPMVYLQQLQERSFPAYSYSSVRGAADGLILGLSIPQVFKDREKTRLSQILRMYYSPEGISLNSQVDDIKSNHISFCNRQGLVQALEQKLLDQMNSYGYLIAQNPVDIVPDYPKARSLYAKEKSFIFGNTNTEIQEYCSRTQSLDRPEDLPRETNLDIIVVMDTSNGDNFFRDQQMIVGHLANQLDLRYAGSRMTILMDKKINTATGTSSKVELEAKIEDTFSSSCAACMVAQIAFEHSNIERDKVISGIDHYLQEKKLNESKLYGTNGKVVLFFNFEKEDGRVNNKIQGSLEQALRDLHLNHQDILFYAVGLDSEQLRKYAKYDASLVFLANDEDVVKKLFEKIYFAPALLQYNDCQDEKADRTISYESMVSPHTVQLYEMPAEYFYKSLKINFKFESQGGNIKVCHSRATVKPENEAKNCKDTTGNSIAEFRMTNPCKSFTKETCSPFYFSVIGMEENEGEMKVDNRKRNYCDDVNGKWCTTLDQIKFKVSHTGVRCSGCFGLGATPLVIMFTVLLTFFVHKRV